MPYTSINLHLASKRKSYPVKVGEREYDSIAHACRVLSIGSDRMKRLAETNGFLETGEQVTYLPRPKKKTKNLLISETTEN